MREFLKELGNVFLGFLRIIIFFALFLIFLGGFILPVSLGKAGYGWWHFVYCIPVSLIILTLDNVNSIKNKNRDE